MYHGFVRAANGKITTFEVRGAGTGAHQGTIPISISAVGDITGTYIDASNVAALGRGNIRRNVHPVQCV